MPSLVEHLRSLLWMRKKHPLGLPVVFSLLENFGFSCAVSLLTRDGVLKKASDEVQDQKLCQNQS